MCGCRPATELPNLNHCEVESPSRFETAVPALVLTVVLIWECQPQVKGLESHSGWLKKVRDRSASPPSRKDSMRRLQPLSLSMIVWGLHALDVWPSW